MGYHTIEYCPEAEVIENLEPFASKFSLGGKGDLMERPIDDPVEAKHVDFHIKPYEIKTFKVNFLATEGWPREKLQLR